jgi:pSer/pThr/pTyr-binding forkhead associated (FHA) protein
MLKLEIQTNGIKSQVEFDSSTKEIYVGRSPSCQIVVLNEDIGRKHCLIKIENNQVTVTDLCTANGTYIDNERIPSDVPTPWFSFSHLRLGMSTELSNHFVEANSPQENLRIELLSNRVQMAANKKSPIKKGHEVKAPLKRPSPLIIVLACILIVGVVVMMGQEQEVPMILNRPKKTQRSQNLQNNNALSSDKASGLGTPTASIGKEVIVNAEVKEKLQKLPEEERKCSNSDLLLQEICKRYATLMGRDGGVVLRDKTYILYLEAAYLLERFNQFFPEDKEEDKLLFAALSLIKDYQIFTKARPRSNIQMIIFEHMTDASKVKRMEIVLNWKRLVSKSFPIASFNKSISSGTTQPFIKDLIQDHIVITGELP